MPVRALSRWIPVATLAYVSYACGGGGFADPPSERAASFDDPVNVSIAAGARADGRFETYVTAVGRTDLDARMDSVGDCTVLLPTDEAFAGLGAERLAYLLDPTHLDELEQLLSGHVLAGAHTLAELTSAVRDNDGYWPLATLRGTTLTFSLLDDVLVATNEAGRSVSLDLGESPRADGVVFVVDRLLASSS